jgi:hypothetical protein
LIINVRIEEMICKRFLCALLISSGGVRFKVVGKKLQKTALPGRTLCEYCVNLESSASLLKVP